ncbi:hypothetical protein BB560_007157 [Smittium megazygosporum]|uniref:Uncharacterized protein n=1 Tax=Smittium megazygosporum TaxID=133381 RepID=A0A2T9XYE1_9FUNG|nr:hypothetical protein BB560_007157 [Smittium megazygosporum]
MLNFRKSSKQKIPSHEDIHSPEIKEPNRLSFGDSQKETFNTFGISVDDLETDQVQPDKTSELSEQSNANFKSLKDVLSGKSGYTNLPGQQETGLIQFSQIKDFFEKLSINPLSKSSEQDTVGASNRVSTFLTKGAGRNSPRLDWILGNDENPNWWVEFPGTKDTQIYKTKGKFKNR